MPWDRAAAITAIAVALLTAGQSTPEAATPGTGLTGTITTSASPTTVSTDANGGTVDAIRATVQAQARAGELDANAANDLANKLDEIDRHLANGENDKVAEKINDLRNKLGELRKDGKLTNAGYTAILPGLDQLASGLPSVNDRDDN